MLRTSFKLQALCAICSLKKKMKKNKLTSTLRLTLMLSVLFVLGCQQAKDFYTYEQVKCNNQSIWTDRTLFDEFDCEMPKTSYPAIRKCTAINYHLVKDKIIEEKHKIICTEEKQACMEGFGCIPYWQYQTNKKSG